MRATFLHIFIYVFTAKSPLITCQSFKKLCHLISHPRPRAVSEVQMKHMRHNTLDMPSNKLIHILTPCVKYVKGRQSPGFVIASFMQWWALPLLG